MTNFHGSDIEKVAAAYQVLPENIINFGVNANPLGLSPKVKSALANHVELITHYPDPTYARLKDAISRYLNVDFNRILPANGTSELIHQIIQYVKPKKALLYTPTYSEYAREVGKQGGKVLDLPLLADHNFRFPQDRFDQYIDQADFILLCNPNNPTATLLTVDELRPLIHAAHERKIPFVLDETYVEFTADPARYSAVSLLPELDNLIVLRGFSKFFAAPGLRLGYGLFGNLELMQKLQDSYPWGVHSLAAFAGRLFLEDSDYLKDTNEYLYAEKQRVLRFLGGLPNITVYPSEVNFFLIRMHQKNATELFLTLLRQGLLIRNFHDEIGSGFFRFCLLDKESNERLLQALAQFLQN